MFFQSSFEIICISYVKTLVFEALKNIDVIHEYGTPQACKPLVAGSEGIEPPIEVLETSVIPFNYEPNSPYSINCRC